jgi:hypothetical protein
MLRHAEIVGIVLGVAVGLSGCGSGDQLKLVQATGVVTLQGMPLDGATVIFVPEKGPLAMGLSDKDGKFTLSTGQSAGVAVGKCGVSVSLSAPDSANDDLQGLSEAERNEKLTQRMGQNVGQLRDREEGQSAAEQVFRRQNQRAGGDCHRRPGEKRF